MVSKATALQYAPTIIIVDISEIAKISITSPIVVNEPTRALLDGKTKGSFGRWLANLNIKRNLTSMFVNKYLPYTTNNVYK